jgi:5-methylcytosine-specific restriction endonuclease McrA
MPQAIAKTGGDRATRHLAKSRARRLRHAEGWDGISDVQILDRDRWRCGICRKRIGKSFKYPHPRSKSIDHLVPLSEGGDDTAANKRAAHLGCNIGRNNRGGGEQLAMIG